MKKIFYYLLLPIIFLLDNSGQAQTLHWQRINSSITTGTSILAKGSYIFAGTIPDGMYYSTNNGNFWIQSSLTEPYIFAFAANDSTIFTGTGNTGVYRSTNNGVTWSVANSGIVSSDLNVSCISASGMNIFMGTMEPNFGRIFYSSNNGDLWTEVGRTGTYINAVSFYNGTIFAAAAGLLFSRTMNDTIWTRMGNGIGNALVTTISPNDSSIFIGTYGGGVFRSTDNGITWTSLSNGLKSLNISALIINNADMYAGTDSNGVFASTDSGNTWMQIDNGLTDTLINALTLNSTSLFAATPSGIYRANISGINAVSEPFPISPTITLTAQPNPARDEMLVHYNTASANAELELFNVLGERVMNAHANGVGEKAFDVSTLPAGMYLLRLHTGTATKTQEVMMVR